GRHADRRRVRQRLIGLSSGTARVFQALVLRGNHGSALSCDPPGDVRPQPEAPLGIEVVAIELASYNAAVLSQRLRQGGREELLEHSVHVKDEGDRLSLSSMRRDAGVSED